jgi:hypothetical protein
MFMRSSDVNLPPNFDTLHIFCTLLNEFLYLIHDWQSKKSLPEVDINDLAFVNVIPDYAKLHM